MNQNAGELASLMLFKLIHPTEFISGGTVGSDVKSLCLPCGPVHRYQLSGPFPEPSPSPPPYTHAEAETHTHTRRDTPPTSCQSRAWTPMNERSWTRQALALVPTPVAPMHVHQSHPNTRNAVERKCDSLVLCLVCFESDSGLW